MEGKARTQRGRGEARKETARKGKTCQRRGKQGEARPGKGGLGS